VRGQLRAIANETSKQGSPFKERRFVFGLLKGFKCRPARRGRDSPGMPVLEKVKAQQIGQTRCSDRSFGSMHSDTAAGSNNTD
jgi:hypothetical protein